MRWFWRKSAKRSARGRGISARPLRRLLVEQFERRQLLTTVMLTPVADATLFQSESGNSDGGGSTLFAGETNSAGARRALLKFDIASKVPAGSTITSVTLQLNAVKVHGIAEPFELHLLTASWGEGTTSSSG